MREAAFLAPLCTPWLTCTRARPSAKRGMSWHGFAVFLPHGMLAPSGVGGSDEGGGGGLIAPTDQSRLFYCHDLYYNDKKQDSASVACSLETLLRYMKRRWPSLSQVVLQYVRPCQLGSLPSTT